MTYYRGTLEEFTTWHLQAMAAEGLPKIGYVDNSPAPENQATIAYSDNVQNPNGTNDYIWLYGRYPINNKTDLTQGDIDNLGWFPSS